MTISVKQNNTYAAATGVWVKVNGVWKQVATNGLDGVGSWATITAVSGSPKRHAYGDWVAFEWTADGSLTTLNGGLVDCFLISGGTGNGRCNGGGGTSVTGLHPLDSGRNDVEIGQGGGGGSSAIMYGAGYPSALGPIVTHWSMPQAGSGGSDDPSTSVGVGMSVSITGNSVIYGTPAVPSPTPNRAEGCSTSSQPGSSGTVIVRVPAAQAAGVSAGSWVTRVDYYAEVTDGIVTDLYQEKLYGDDSVRTENGSYASPEQPDDLVPCDPSVAEGWTYADGEFTPPPPDPSWREEAIEALKQQLKDLQKDT